MYHFCSFFSFAYFSNSNFTSPKKKHKNRLRERVLSREGSLNFSHKEREKRERESTREGTFIAQNRKRGLIEIDRERERERRNLFLIPSFFPFALFARNFEFKKYSRGNDVDERDGVEGNRETR